MIFKLQIPGFLTLSLAAPLLFGGQLPAASAGLRGTVDDPSGAVVAAAGIVLSGAGRALKTASGPDGSYRFLSLVPGTYTLTASAKGFAPLTIDDIRVAADKTVELNLHLKIAAERQQVTVNGQSQGVGVGQDQNLSATILRGSALDAFSDDPDELESELEALAGPAAGPDGGQIYIDGFAGGKLPPKSSILEIRVNQDPFSAAFDRIGYGRVEIITKPGTQKFQGSVASYGGTSALNTANPLVTMQPSYYQYSVVGNLSGPLSKKASYFFSAFIMRRQNQGIINAVDPKNTGATIAQAFPTPIDYISIAPRVDFALGQRNTVSVRDSFYRTRQTGSGVGTLNLPSQASTVVSEENALELGDTFLVSSHIVNETHFRWSHIVNNQRPSDLTATITVQGAFTAGGSSAGVELDTQNNFELQNYSTATAGNHTLRFGTRLRAYDDSSYSTSGANGSYLFNTVADYRAGTPAQYTGTTVSNPLAKVLLFDGALFLQDDWRVRPNFDLGLGLRLEGQNRIRDHADWAPRIALAWSPGRAASTAPKTVLRAGYGWFFNRFTVPDFFSANSGTPYVLEAIHDNLINERSFVVDNPSYPVTASQLALGSSSYHTIDPDFHSALEMQGGVGIDRRLAKGVTANVTYLYTQGVHQYLTNNVTAPAFDTSTYRIAGAAPSAFNYQFQSGGFFRQNQLIFTGSVALKRFVFNTTYLVNEAKSDTQGVGYVPSVAADPGFDYGRASFGYRQRLIFTNSYSGPWGVVFASMLVAKSGTPYNLTIGDDLTGNNQFNARPAYGDCGSQSVVETQYGCLDTDPGGKGERIVPYGAGVGPVNVVYHARLSKVIGIGPRIKTAGEGYDLETGSTVANRGLGSGGAAVHLDAAAPRRYGLTLVAGAANVFNMVNYAPPNAVLKSPLFGRHQALAGAFTNPTPGNRSITFQSNFTF